MAYGIKYLLQNEKESPEVAKLASRGIKGDDTIGHLDTGEIVVPKSAQTPGLMALFAKNMRSRGIDPMTHMVGSKQALARRNPYTGAQQFFDPGDESQGGDTTQGGSLSGPSDNGDTGDDSYWGGPENNWSPGNEITDAESRPPDAISSWVDTNILGYSKPRTNRQVREGMGLSISDYYQPGGRGASSIVVEDNLNKNSSGFGETLLTGLTGVLENLYELTPFGLLTDIELTGKDIFGKATQPGLYASLPLSDILGIPGYDIFRGEKVEKDGLFSKKAGESIFGESIADYSGLFDSGDTGGYEDVVSAAYTPTQMPTIGSSQTVPEEVVNEPAFAQTYVTPWYGVEGGEQEAEGRFFPRSYYYSEVA